MEKLSIDGLCYDPPFEDEDERQRPKDGERGDNVPEERCGSPGPVRSEEQQQTTF